MLKFKTKYPGSGESISSYNPATGKIIGEIKGYTVEDGRAAVERAKLAQKKWEALGLDGRIDVLRRFQQVLMDKADEVCKLIAMENGKPLQEAMETEVLPIIDLLGYFLKRAPKILGDRKISMHLLKYRRSYINYRPRGVMLVISPWNFPFTIPVGETIMGLLAGNVVIQKPASLTPLIALKTRELFDEAGLDPDVFQVAPAPGAIASEMISMGVDYVNFTGSTSVGLRVSELCGKLLIPCSMELGGKDPLIVRKDADLDLAAGAIVWGAYANSGQICAAVERVYAHEDIYDRLVELVVERVKKLRVGDPLAAEVDMGPMVDPNQLAIVEQQAKDAVSKGAKCLTGGKRIEGAGQFFEPTVFVNVDESMDVVSEETFGPLLPIIKVSSDEEAIARANDSIYGLNAYIFSGDRQEARNMAEKLESGSVVINDVLINHGLPETPWQGVKKSGTGRVHSDDGLRDLCVAYHINEESSIPSLKNNPFWYPYGPKTYGILMSLAKTLYGNGLRKKLSGLKALVAGIFGLGRL